MTENTTTPDSTTTDATEQAEGQTSADYLAGVAAEQQAADAGATALPQATWQRDLDALLAPYTVTPERTPFTPGYAVTEGVRILRARLHADEHGVATATFEGTLQSPTWIEAGRGGSLKLFAEVARSRTERTTLTVALVPTGKRVPMDGVRIGGANGTHAYLLDIKVEQAEAAAEDFDTADEG